MVPEKLLYIVCTVTMSRYFLEKRNIPNPRETFFVTAEICSSQLGRLSTITPRYFIISTMETFSSPTTKEGFATSSSLISFSRFLLLTTRLCVLATFRDNLLRSQDLRLLRSSLTQSLICVTESDKNIRLGSSAYILTSQCFICRWRSLIHI